MEKTMMAQSSAAQIPERKNWAAVALESLEVLLVEDDDADAFLIRMALKKNPHVSQVIHVHDGIEALDWLDSGMAVPDVAIIDLHMPRKNGHSLLIELRCRPEWNFPTIVLTSSKAREDATRSRLRGANHFMTKPDTVEELHTRLANVMNAI
jgi:CheY-like chemotaxis protein